MASGLRRKVLVAASAVIVIASSIALHASCGSDTSMSDGMRTADSAAIIDVVGADAPDASSPPDAPDTTAKPDGALLDAEFCPDPSYPPRSDGCPCRPGSPSSPYQCDETTVGKRCEYLQDCPPDMTVYTCQWIYEKETKPYLGWVGSSAACPVPSNDGG